MSARGGFPHGGGAGGVQETCGAGDAEQVIGIRGVKQIAQVGIGDTGDVIGDVLAADEGGHSRLVGSQRLLTGLVFAFVTATCGETGTLVGVHAEGDGGVIEGRGTGRGVDDGVGAALGGGLGESLHNGHTELSHAWISHRNSVAEMEVIICKGLAVQAGGACAPWDSWFPTLSLRTRKVGVAGTCGAASSLRLGETKSLAGRI